MVSVHGTLWPTHEQPDPDSMAHVLFGEQALFETAERLYDDPDFIPRKWDLDENGKKKPNKWTQWRTFSEQGYVNELTIPEFRAMASRTGFRISRQDDYGFAKPAQKKRSGTSC